MPTPSASVQTRHGLYGGARRLYGTFTGKASAGATGLATSLTAFWPLDESSGNALDSHTNSLDLTDNGSVGTNATGSPSGARCRVLTAASNHYFSRADEALVRFGGQDWSIAMWVYTTYMGTQAFFGKLGSTSTEEVQCYLNGATGNWRTYTYDGNTTVANYAYGSSWASGDNAWHSIVVTREHSATTLKLYFDGVLEDPYVDTTEDVAAGTGAADFMLGYYYNRVKLNGRLSATAFWQGRTLTADDVTTWHNGGSELAYTDIVVAGGGDPEGLLVGGKLIGRGLLGGRLFR